MNANQRDYAALNKFNLERKPVGIKFTATRPEGLVHLDKTLNFCEMLKEAQATNPFYVSKGDFHCVEPMLLGFEEPEPILVSGLFGGKEGLFKEDRACRSMYTYLPKMLKGSVHSVAFAAVDQMTFDPDVLVLVITIAQAQTLLRSVNYSTGEMIQSKMTPVVACSWLFVYPVVSQEINYAVTGLSLGMSALGVFPPGLVIMSVPWSKIGTMLENLQEMKLTSSAAPVGGNEHRRRVKELMENLRAEIKE
jgi:uncharacterized protein (DUF169 family)